MKRFSIVQNFIYFFLVSLALIGGSIYAFVSNLRWSIEFTWGIKMTIAWEKKINTTKFTQDFKKYDLVCKYVFDNGNTDLEIRSLRSNVKYDNKMLTEIKEYLKQQGYIKTYSDIISVAFVWPTVGEYMKSAAKQALIWGIIIMAIYILIAFVSVREYFQPWIFSLVTVLTLMHDVIMAAGWYWIRMHFNPLVVVDTIFVMAILTVLGYSVNDTIIIFDRIRENIVKYADQLRKWQKKLYEIFDESLYQTMRRSLFTSLSTLLVVACMYIFGNQVFKDFSFVIFVWVLFGTYSSIFLAAPGAYRINRLLTKKE